MWYWAFREAFADCETFGLVVRIKCSKRLHSLQYEVQVEWSQHGGLMGTSRLEICSPGQPTTAVITWDWGHGGIHLDNCLRCGLDG